MPVKVSVLTSCLKLEPRRGIEVAAELGAEAVQLWTARGDFDPSVLGRTGRQDLRHFVQSQGLKISALCGDYGVPFGDPARADLAVELTRGTIDLAADLGTTVVTTHIGEFPDDEADRTWQNMLGTCAAVGEYAEDRGVFVAAETGPSPPERLTRFLERLGEPFIAVNYDPANLVMSGFDPVTGVFSLRAFIVHTHAKDGSRDQSGRPREVRLGEGQVDWKQYLHALDEVGFKGYHAIERETGENPVADVRDGIQFLRRF